MGIGLRVVPVPAHDAVGAGDHFADLARGQLAAIAVDDHDVDAAPRHSAGCQNLLAAGMIALAEQPLRDETDRHGRLALAIDLRELGTEDLQGLLEVAYV